MTHVAEELFDDAMKLSDRERRVLALWLLDTVGDEPLEEVEEAWAKEATRRLNDLRAGRVVPVAWEDARIRIFARE